MELTSLLLFGNAKIIDCVNDLEYSCDYINARSNSLAYYLHDNGFSSSSQIAISIKNSVEFLIAFIGVLKFGATPLLFNIRWPEFYSENIEHDIILTYDLVKSIPENDYQSIFSSNNFVLYTSGSSSLPKSVKIGVKEHTSLIYNRSINLKNTTKKIIMAPLCHMSALSNIEISLAAGQTILLMEKFNVRTLEDTILKYTATQIHAIPSHMRIFLDNNINVYPSIKSILLGTEASDSKLLCNLKYNFPNAEISLAYGSTELGPNLFIKHPNNIKTPEASVGYPNPEIEYRIVNGVLEVKSPFMMKGYIDQKDSFTVDGFFITNDLFEVDQDGFYYCLGPNNDSFKSGGNRIIPSSIESVILRYCDIQNVCVIDIEDEKKGKIPIACYTSSIEINDEELALFCSKFLMPYQIPKKFIRLKSMPINSTGKINKKSLRNFYGK